jgi:sporulation protein YlmC with PRC-barrel domain
LGEPRPKLMVSGWVQLPGCQNCRVEIRRGMLVQTHQGRVVGNVSAVVMDHAGQKVTHLLVDRLPQAPEYRLLPVTRILRVDGEAVYTDLTRATAARLERWLAGHFLS